MKIEEGSVKHLVVLIATISIMGAILFPIFDLLLCKLITHAEFVYTAQSYVIEPIYFGIILGIVLWALSKNQKKK